MQHERPERYRRFSLQYNNAVRKESKQCNVMPSYWIRLKHHINTPATEMHCRREQQRREKTKEPNDIKNINIGRKIHDNPNAKKQILRKE